MNTLLQIAEVCRMLPRRYLLPSKYLYFRKWKQEGVFEELMYQLRDLVRKSCGRKFPSPSIIKTLEVYEHLTMYSQSKIDCESSTRKFRVRSGSRLLPIRRDVVKEFEHRISKFMFCPIELRVDDLLSEKLPQPLDQV